MNKLILLLFVFIIHQSLSAQKNDISIKTSKEFKTKVKVQTFSTEALGSDSSFYYFDFIPFHEVFDLFQIGYPTSHFIGKLSKDMKTFTRKAIVVGSKKEAKSVHGIYYLNDSIIITRELKDYFTAQFIDKEMLSLNKETHKLCKIHLTDEQYRDGFIIKQSADKTKFLLFYYINNKKGTPIRFGIRVFNQSLELLWVNDNISPKFNGDLFEFTNFKLSNNGDAYFLGAISTSNHKAYKDGGADAIKHSTSEVYRIDIPGEHFQLYRIADKGNSIKFIDLQIPNQAIRDLNYYIANNSTVSVYGVYCKENRISAMGTFIFNVNLKDNKIDNINLKSFDKNLIYSGYDKKEMDYYNKQIEKNREWDPFNYHIGELKTMSNGRKYFISEKWLRGHKSNSTSTFTYFYYSDIYISYTDSDNAINQNYKVSKRQYMQLFPNYCSYVCLEKEDKLYFIFSEFPKTKSGYFKKVSLNVVSLDNEGNQQKAFIKTSDELSNKSKLMLTTTQMQENGNFNNDEVMLFKMNSSAKAYSFEKISIKP